MYGTTGSVHGHIRAENYDSRAGRALLQLAPWLRRDRALRENFFSVRIFQYAGATISQLVRKSFDELALDRPIERETAAGKK
jgi:N-glycosylase/DNA lyase